MLGCGLETAIVIATRELIRAGRVVGGIAILENAYHQTAKLEAVPVDLSDVPVRKTPLPLFEQFYLKTIILPRQARDRHRKS